MGWLEDAVNVLQLIALPIVIVVTAYGAFSAYLGDFWRGFMLGALVVFLPMLVFNIYLARRTKREASSPPASAGQKAQVLPSKVETKVAKRFRFEGPPMPFAVKALDSAREAQEEAKSHARQWLLALDPTIKEVHFGTIIDSLQEGDYYSTVNGYVETATKKRGYMIRVMKNGAIDEDNSFLFS